MVELNDYYRDKGICNLGHVPEDDDPYLIDFPVSTSWAMHYILKGYRVPERMIRFRDSEDRREYLQWLRGEQVEDKGEIALLRREIAMLRKALEDRRPIEQTRAPEVRPPQAQPMPKQEQPQPKPKLRGFEV